MSSQQSQTLNALMTAGLLPNLDGFLSSLSILCTYHHQFTSPHSPTYPLLPTFFDLIDPSVDLSIDSLLTASIDVYSQLNTVLIDAYKTALDHPTKTHPRSLLLQTIFQNTTSWVHVSLNTLIIAISQINFSSFLLLNTHEAIGINQLHLITINDLSNKSLFKLQSSTRFLTPPQKWLHTLSLVATFFEYLFIHFPLYTQNLFNFPYNAQILQHLWVLPYSFTQHSNADQTTPTEADVQSSTSHSASLTTINLTVQQYQQYTFSLLLSQPCLLQHPQISKFLTTQQNQLNPTPTTPDSLLNLNAAPTRPITTTTTTTTTTITDFLPLFSILILLLTPLVIYSSPELLYIQSLRQSYLLSGDSNLDILTKFELKDNRSYHHTLKLSSFLSSSSYSTDTLDLLSSPKPGEKLTTITQANEDNASTDSTDFTQHSEITKLSLFYNNNAHLQRLLVDIYQLDLAQQEKYYNICQLRTKIDAQLHLIISRFIMLIYNHFFIRLQCIHHQIIPAAASFTKPFFDTLFQEITSYQSIHSDQQYQSEQQSQGDLRIQSSPALRQNQKPFFPVWTYDQYFTFTAIDTSSLMTTLPSLIMFTYHQTFAISRPAKRFLFLLQFYLQSGYITASTPQTFEITTATCPTSSSLSSLQSILVDTLASIDYISSRLTSPVPITSAIPTSISTLAQQFSTQSSLITPTTALSNGATSTLTGTADRFMVSPSSPLFLPTTCGRDMMNDPFLSFSQNALFQYPLHALYTHHPANLSHTLSPTTYILYFDLLLSPDTKHNVDYSASLLPTQMAQDAMEDYYTPRFGNSVLATPLQSSQKDINGDDINQQSLTSYQQWKDVDAFSFTLFLYRLAIQQAPSTTTQLTSLPCPLTPGGLKRTQSLSPNCIIDSVYSINSISTSGASSTTHQSPSFISPGTRYSLSYLSTVFTLGANDLRFLIDQLLAKLNQQPLYLSQLTYPANQRVKYMVQINNTQQQPHNLHNSIELLSSSQTSPPQTPTQRQAQLSPSLLSLDLLTVLQLTTSLQLFPQHQQQQVQHQHQHQQQQQQQSQQQSQLMTPSISASRSDLNQTTFHTQPSLSLFCGLLFSADTSQFITPFDELISTSQLTPPSPFLPPSYYLITLVTAVRLILTWKEWDNYRQDEVVESIMGAIQLLREQKADIHRLVDEENKKLCGNQNDQSKDITQWTATDETLLDYIFAILGQFVIKIDEKSTEAF